MHVPTYEQVAFAWRPDARDERRFRVFLALVITAFLFAGIVLSSIPLPKKERAARVEVPERVAKFITERPKPKVVEAPKPEPKAPPPRPEPKFERKPQEERKPLTNIEVKARQKAEDSGLLALSRDLSDLIDTVSVQSMTNGRLSKSGDSQSVAAVNTDILTSRGAQGSGGVKQDVRDGDVGRSQLDEGQRQVARQLLASKGQIGTAGSEFGASGRQGMERGDNLRSEADVAYVMDKHKSILHSIYRRARRSNPGLQGKIVLEITILPSGQVSDVRVKSSELNDKSLEVSLVARIRQFDFGSRPVEPLTIVVPVEFLPS
ncbi:MAG: energy transducer TonB [Gammaproteobacteria bacterium HGW-Gammaproteobacteria-1]|jgi:TonB family protein|nr:MAG: energy transducer TonB [Gammaproteobacteria bacterium HGW-Gammaproteobacteria-1]